MSTLETATVDHVLARSKGGTDGRGNLVLACEDCNDAKGGKSAAKFLASIQPTKGTTMKLKLCLHPEDHQRQLEDDGAWCSLCGALQNGENAPWKLPGTMLEPKRFIVATPHELPPHSDRRAWEGFAAAMYPTAVAIVASENPNAPAAEKRPLSATLAGLMADDLMGEWAQRFDAERGP
jgi:hypothetical protein